MEQVELSPYEEYSEYLRCQNDVEYFLNNYVNIPTLNGLVPFILSDTQKLILKHFTSFVNSNISRYKQTGKTSLLLGYLLHYIIFNTNKFSVSFSVLNTRDYFNMFIDMYSRCTFNHKPKIINKTNNFITFDNGNKIMFTTYSGPYYIAKGFSVDLTLLDEYDFVDNIKFNNILQEVLPAVKLKGKIKAVTSLGSETNFSLLEKCI